MQGATRTVSLDQSASLEQIGAHVGLGQAGDPGTDGELGGRHDLSLDASDLADNATDRVLVPPAGGGRLDEVAALQAPAEHLLPRQRPHARTLAIGAIRACQTGKDA